MIHVNALSSKLSDIGRAHQYQANRLKELNRILGLKRKADIDYCNTLQSINSEIVRYLENKPGFMNDMIESYQSYLAILHQQKTSLIEAYSHEVIEALITAES